jgi:hypothetical protein
MSGQKYSKIKNIPFCDQSLIKQTTKAVVFPKAHYYFFFKLYEELHQNNAAFMCRT